MLVRVVFCGLALCSTAAADEVTDAIQVLQSVQPGGGGSAPARQSLKTLTAAGDKALMPVLKGFRDASPLAANWLRNCYDQIVEGIRADGRKLPADELEAFIRETSESPVARRLAYESLRSQDPSAEARIIPERLLDPSPEFRRDAVARLIAEAEASADPAAASALYRRAFQGAVHEDQVQKIAEALRNSGETVDIQQHFGFLTGWSVTGPFDNTGEKGFQVAYPPEIEAENGTQPDLNAEYDGQKGKVRWTALTTADDYGIIDIARQLENHKGSVMYATTRWNSPAAQTAEIRLGTPNAWKLWVNGKLVFEREEYHRSSQMDQYRVPISLEAGENSLLLKVCQNEQTEDWAQRYQFQVRICDSTGSALPSAAVALRNQTKSGARR